MKKKVLVTYATKHGSTGEIADKISTFDMLNIKKRGLSPLLRRPNYICILVMPPSANF